MHCSKLSSCVLAWVHPCKLTSGLHQSLHGELSDGQTPLDLSQGMCRHKDDHLAGRQHSEKPQPGQAGVTAQLCQERLWVLFAGAEESCSCPAGLKETPAVGGVQELVLGLLEHIRKQ